MQKAAICLINEGERDVHRHSRVKYNDDKARRVGDERTTLESKTSGCLHWRDCGLVVGRKTELGFAASFHNKNLGRPETNGRCRDGHKHIPRCVGRYLRHCQIVARQLADLVMLHYNLLAGAACKHYGD
ncbi:hypothetical protein HK096_001185 [Nowakowskiella sp. JEL0078]|nr:hypothetical protein HK096_001185 [Nowakowskiella sp. JEL0078]